MLESLASVPSLTPPAPLNGADRLRRAQDGLEPNAELAGRSSTSAQQRSYLAAQLSDLPAEPMQQSRPHTEFGRSHEQLPYRSSTNGIGNGNGIQRDVSRAAQSNPNSAVNDPSWEVSRLAKAGTGSGFTSRLSSSEGKGRSSAPRAPGSLHGQTPLHELPSSRPVSKPAQKRPELLEDFDLEDELQAMTGSMLKQGDGPQKAKFSLPKPPVIVRKAIQLGSPNGQGPAPAWVKRRANAEAANAPAQVGFDGHCSGANGSCSLNCLSAEVAACLYRPGVTCDCLFDG